jgi:hypothetical protein
MYILIKEVCRKFFIVILIFIASACKAQYKIQPGVGLNVGTLNLRDSGNEDFLKIPYGISLHCDYRMSSSYILKTRVEFTRQNLNIPFLNQEELSIISVPVLIHKSLTKNMDHKWNLGVEGGFSWDFIAKMNKMFKEPTGLYVASVQSQRSVSNFQKPNITARLGLNIAKTMNNNSTIQFYLYYHRSLQNWDKIYFETESPIEIDNKFYSLQVIRNIIDLSQNGLQFGVYFGFGIKKLSKS